MNVVIFGFIAGFSLIAAIGAQNAHLINVGLSKQNWLIVALLCLCGDIALVNLVVWGVGALSANNYLLRNSITVLGALILLRYALNFYRSAYFGVSSLDTSVDDETNHTAIPFKSLVITTLAVTFLNPHAYIDTVVLLGGISSTLPSQIGKVYFIIGSILASMIWFFSLGGFAALLAPLFKKPISWRILNTINGSFMLFIAWHLITLLHCGLHTS